jgi:S1-C subfamily serine protease
VVPGDLLDLVLLALTAAFAVAGYRQGFIIGVLSLAGFLGGTAAGAIIAPGISRVLTRNTPRQAIIAIVVVFLAAVLGMLLASGIGVAVRSRVTGRPATFLDSVGGAAVNVISVLVVAWLIGSIVVGARFPTVARQVNNSIVLRTVDGLMPRGALDLTLFPPLRGLISSDGLYSPVFSALGAEGGLNLPAPDAAVVNVPRAVAAIERSVVKIEGVAPSCSLKIEGSGFVISPGHVLTNAHVVAGVTQGPYVFARDGRAYPGRVVFYDPQRDISILDVPGLAAPALRFGGPAVYGADAIVAGYPLNHSLTLSAARVGQDIDAYGPNIYQSAVVHRQIYEIRATVRPGNSGGPLMAPDGQVYGVVFAASTSTSDIGYALTAAEIAGDVHAGELDSQPVSTQACQGS